MSEEEIFQSAAELPKAERSAYVLAACNGRPEVRARIERLLSAHDDTDFMQRAAEHPSSLLRARELGRHNPERCGDWIGQYKLLQEIGEGGYGVVYMAQQDQAVRRTVALKVVKMGMDTRSVIARFEQERQALALMEHPNIAKVLDAGATPQGRPFFVMELVRGIRVTEFCEQNNLSVEDRVNLFVTVCLAVQHAHQKGIIHRDIKPSNILVTLHDGVPVPKVIDFGIAKATTGEPLTDKTLFTAFEQFVGTPAYMSPEQAEMSGLDVDTRSDIYSLGVLLYELLTGQTPFDGQELVASGIDRMRKTIREKAPLRPSTKLTQTLRAVSKIGDSRAGHATSEIPENLDWIVMKCLEKDRSRRYATVNDLAADLRRHLSHDAVLARPPTPLYRLQITVRRNKVVFVSAGAVLAALFLGLCVALLLARRAIKAEQTTRRNAYAAEMNVAFHALNDENNLGEARNLLNRQRPKKGETDLRGFEWRHLWNLCQGDEVKTFGDGGARATAFSPDGKLIAYSFGKIIVRAAASLKEVVTLSPETPSYSLSFAPRAPLLASGSASSVTLWNTETWKEMRSLTNAMYPSLFSPDGRWLLTGAAHAFRLWDTQTWQPVGYFPDAPDIAFNARNAVAFSPDSQFLVTISGAGRDLGDYLQVRRLPGLEKHSELRFESEPGSVAFTPDGKLVAGLWDGQVVLVDVQTDQRWALPKEHTAWVTAIAVGGTDARTFATASGDRTITLWDARTFKPRVRLRGHVDAIWSLAMSPDGLRVISGSSEAASSAEGTTMLWSTETRHTIPTLKEFGQMAGFLDDGRKVVGGAGNRWSIWTPQNGARADVFFPSSPPVFSSGQPYDVLSKESIGVVGRTNGAIELWNLTQGTKLVEWSAHEESISVVRLSPNGKRLATAAARDAVKLWDMASHQEVTRLNPVKASLLGLAFSSDGNSLVGSGWSTNIWVWDINSGAIVRTLDAGGPMVTEMAFSPDGTLLAAASYAGVLLWEWPSGRPLLPLKGHVLAVTGVAFSPDGKTLASAGFDKKVKLWNVATRQELITFSTSNVFPWLAFSPDQRTLVIGDLPMERGNIQLLAAPSFEDIAAKEAIPVHTSNHGSGSDN